MNDLVKWISENDEIKGNEDNDKGEGREESDTFIVVIFRQDTNFDSQKGDTLSSESKFENKSAINSNVDSSSNNFYN